MEKLCTELFPFSSWLYSDCSCFIFPSLSSPDRCHFHEECPAHGFMKVKLFTERSLCLKRRRHMSKSTRRLCSSVSGGRTQCPLSSELSGSSFPVRDPRLQGGRVGSWILEAVTRASQPCRGSHRLDCPAVHPPWPRAAGAGAGRSPHRAQAEASLEEVSRCSEGP